MPSSTMCAVEGCTESAYSRGWCPAHYARWYRHGDPLQGGALRRKGRAECGVSGCARTVYAYGYCSPHYQRFKEWGHPKADVPLRAPQGSGHQSKDGYRYLFSRTHPNANKYGKVLEHVVVMSEVLDRPLRKGETVHHKNGVKSDNRPENLELWITAHPYGQRIEDLVQFATEILTQYGTEGVVTSILDAVRKGGTA